MLASSIPLVRWLYWHQTSLTWHETSQADPKMPKSRKLLAVPFVGKDVPSRASEFSHPDVVIGEYFWSVGVYPSFPFLSFPFLTLRYRDVNQATLYSIDHPIDHPIDHL